MTKGGMGNVWKGKNLFAKKKKERIWTRLTFFKFSKDNTALIW